MEWLKAEWVRARERLLFVPLVFVVAGIVLAQTTLQIDRRLSDADVPRFLQTTVEAADSVLSTIAGGLIGAITLLLSLVLVSVQIASSQFSPRTVRDWIGDRTQQRTIGIVLATTIFCLMVLRETRSIDDSFAFAPHGSVLVAVLLAVVSLIAVVYSVDHLSNSMRIGSVAQKLALDTLDAISSLEAPRFGANPAATPASNIAGRPSRVATATPVPAKTAGWVQRLDFDAIIECLPEGSSASVHVAPGAFVMSGEPLMWTDVDLDDGQVETLANRLVDLGDSRKVDHDVGYGLLQLSDIALRSLSSGVNDPNTAADVVVNLGPVILALWERERDPEVFESDGRRVEVASVGHRDYLDSAFGQIIRYAAGEFEVLSTLIRTLDAVRREIERRELPGPLEPIDDMLAEIQDVVERSSLSPADVRRLHDLADRAADRRAAGRQPLPIQ